MAKKRKTELDIDPTEESVAPPAAEEAPPPEDGEEAKGEEEEAPAASSNAKKIIIIVVGALLLLGGIGTGVYFYLEKKAQEEAQALKEQEELERRMEELMKKIPKIPTYKMARFFIPLQEKEGEEKFLTLIVTLELNSDKVVKELNKLLASLREAIYFHLNTKSSADLSGEKKMRRIEEDLKIIINRNLQTGHAKRVYFLEYIIQ